MIKSLVLLSAILSTSAFAWEQGDHWFNSNFQEIRRFYMVDQSFNRKSLRLFRNVNSNNCYMLFSAGNQGNFSKVPCEDFLDKSKEQKIRERIAKEKAARKQKYLELQKEFGED